jgi:hypothetical protein
MFVILDGEDIARKVFRSAQNCLNSVGREGKIQDVFHRKIKIDFLYSK